jgi:hypothetical protein
MDHKPSSTSASPPHPPVPHDHAALLADLLDGLRAHMRTLPDGETVIGTEALLTVRAIMKRHEEGAGR